MAQQIQEIWKRFDEVKDSVENPDTKAIIEAIKLQTELINLRLGAIQVQNGASFGVRGG